MIPTVSVILPCYNGVQWINKAIESVLTQTYTDFELLIIDDGSTDNSKEVVTSYLCDERVSYFYQENRGFSAAINRGLSESNGCLISFIGQDDMWLPNKLETQKKYLNKHKNVGFVYSNYYSIDLNGMITGLMKGKNFNSSTREQLIEQLFLSNFIGFETVLVKQKCFDELGFLDERLVGCSDHDMWLRVAGKFQLGYLDVPLVKKRSHKFQLTQSSFESFVKDEFLIVKDAISRYPFLKTTERKKLAIIYHDWGIHLLQKGNAKDAKKKFYEAIRNQPWKLKTVIAYLTPALYTFILEYFPRLTNPYLFRQMLFQN